MKSRNYRGVPLALVLTAATLLFTARCEKAPTAGSDKEAGTDSAAGAKPKADDPVVIHVNGQEIRKSEFEAAMDNVPPQMKVALQSPAGRKAVAEQLVELKLLQKQAEKEGVLNDPAVKARIEIERGRIIANAAITKMMEREGTPDLQKYYNEHKSKFELAKARQILIAYQGGQAQARDGKTLSEADARAKAQKIADEIRAGAKFEQVAKKESDDKNGGAKGGDMGTISRGSVPKEIEDVLFTLPVNSVSEPVRSRYGYHIFQVQSRETKSFDEVKGFLEQRYPELKAQDLVEGLKKTAQIKYEESFFGKS